ncbi:MAG: hypothetical protein BWY70_01919 [Bacteroidetes bacterium ADurb.Bin408]|nr:MAG: hypothetical protein BWY70_01919 [Bacteroidetes bacterium ADurb.Bin408]
MVGKVSACRIGTGYKKCKNIVVLRTDGVRIFFRSKNVFELYTVANRDKVKFQNGGIKSTGAIIDAVERGISRLVEVVRHKKSSRVGNIGGIAGTQNNAFAKTEVGIVSVGESRSAVCIFVGCCIIPDRFFPSRAYFRLCRFHNAI